jgi:hypothetical protein
MLVLAISNFVFYGLGAQYKDSLQGSTRESGEDSEPCHSISTEALPMMIICMALIKRELLRLQESRLCHLLWRYP